MTNEDEGNACVNERENARIAAKSKSFNSATELTRHPELQAPVPWRNCVGVRWTTGKTILIRDKFENKTHQLGHLLTSILSKHQPTNKLQPIHIFSITCTDPLFAKFCIIPALTILIPFLRPPRYDFSAVHPSATTTPTPTTPTTISTIQLMHNNNNNRDNVNNTINKDSSNTSKNREMPNWQVPPVVCSSLPSLPTPSTNHIKGIHSTHPSIASFARSRVVHPTETMSIYMAQRVN